MQRTMCTSFIQTPDVQNCMTLSEKNWEHPKHVMVENMVFLRDISFFHIFPTLTLRKNVFPPFSHDFPRIFPGPFHPHGPKVSALASRCEERVLAQRHAARAAC